MSFFGRENHFVKLGRRLAGICWGFALFALLTAALQATRRKNIFWGRDNHFCENWQCDCLDLLGSRLFCVGYRLADCQETKMICRARKSFSKIAESLMFLQRWDVLQGVDLRWHWWWGGGAVNVPWDAAQIRSYEDLRRSKRTKRSKNELQSLFGTKVQNPSGHEIHVLKWSTKQKS